MTIPIAAAWEIRRLWELPLQIIDGDRSAKYPKRSEFRDSGVLFLNTTNIVNDRLDLSGAVFITEEKFAEIQKGRARRRDILMTTRGSIGKVALFDCEYDEALINAQILILRADDAQLDSRFLFYAVRSPLFKTHVANFASGAAQPQIPIVDLREVEIPVPALPAQRRIARILSAYDDLIENNQRRIQILETMARALYREWFVEFRFPGHDKIPRVASPLGDIPKGWEIKKIGDIAENIRRNVPKGDLDVPRPYVGLEHIPRRSLALDAWEMTTELGSNKLEFRKGEVIFGKIRPYFHKVSVSPFDGVCSADTFVIRARRPEDYAFMVACVSSDAFVAHASATANGSKMPRANWDVLEKYEVVIPQGKVSRHFSALLVGILAQEQTLMFQTHNLRRTRNLLLPRLLSGQVALTDTAA